MNDGDDDDDERNVMVIEKINAFEENVVNVE